MVNTAESAAVRLCMTIVLWVHMGLRSVVRRLLGQDEAATKALAVRWTRAADPAQAHRRSGRR